MNLQYEDYAALITWFSDATSVRLRGKTNKYDPFVGSGPSRFSESIAAYRATLVDRQDQFIAEQKKHGIEYTEAETRFDDYLYRPCYFSVFGNSDAIGLCLVDEVDAATTIGIKANANCDKHILGFCPRVDSIRESLKDLLTSTELGRLSVFCDFRSLFSPGANETSLSRTGLPLAAVAEINLSGVAEHLGGQRMTEAITKLIAVSTAKTLIALEKEFDSVALPATSTVNHSNKIALLHGQGDTDIAMVFFGRNYSVIASVLLALRQLRLTDLRPFLPLDDMIRASPFGQKYVDDSELGQAGAISQLGNAQLLSATHTTMGVSPEVFTADADQSEVQGVVDSRVDVSLVPGAYQEINRVHHQLVKSDAVNRPDLINLNTGKDYAVCTVGARDLIFTWPRSRRERDGEREGDHGSYVQRTFMPTRSLIHLSSAAYRQLGLYPNGHPIQDGASETGVLGLNSVLSLPVPIPLTQREYVESLLGQHQVPSGGDSPELLKYYWEIGQGLFSYDRALPDDSPGFELSKLSLSLKKLQLPRTLRRAIISFFEEYALLISDHSVAHQVVDMYDGLATFYEILTVDLMAWVDQLTPNQRSAFSEELIVEELQVNIAAFWQTLRSRIYPHSSSDASRYGWQTNCAKYIRCADSALKCSIGVVRALDQRYVRSRLGGILELSENPRTLLSRSVICSQMRRRPRTPEDAPYPSLTRVRLDFSTLFNGFGYLECLHEGFHTVSECYGTPRGLPNSAADLTRSQQLALWSRQEELFVQCMVLLFVFKGDWRLFWRVTFAELSLSPYANRNHPRDLFYAALETYVTVFIATYYVSQVMHNVPYDELINASSWDSVRQRALGNVFPTDTRDLGDLQKDCYRWFRKYFRRHYILQERIVDHNCSDLFEHAARHAMTKFEDMHHSEVDRAFAVFVDFHARTRLLDRRPESALINQAFENVEPARATPHPGAATDELLLICEHVAHYFETIIPDSHENRRVHTFRDLDGKSFQGSIIFSATLKGKRTRRWSEFQIDPLANRVRSPLSMCRREILSKEIVISRNLWDIATRLGARRMHELAQKYGENRRANQSS